ncbi:hypothetical protein DOY81_012247 [Sarcophaga bullata]|nr:hypothetical protein DOY81_012247 [Sarcophaga bullata]
MIDEIIYQPKIPIDENLTLRQHLDDNTTTVVMEIRKALTILFHFSRKLSPNKDFENDLREWMEINIIAFTCGNQRGSLVYIVQYITLPKWCGILG